MLRNAKITAFLLAALLAVTQPLAADHHRGEVMIKSHVKDAAVYVDGGYIGEANKNRKLELAPGIHEIEIRDHRGRIIREERVNVPYDGKTKIKID